MRAISKPVIFATSQKLNQNGLNSEPKQPQPSVIFISSEKTPKSSNMFKRPILMNDLSSAVSYGPIRNFVSRKNLENEFNSAVRDKNDFKTDAPLNNEKDYKNDVSVESSQIPESESVSVVSESIESGEQSKSSASSSSCSNDNDSSNGISSSYFSEAYDIIDTAGPIVHSEEEDEAYFLREVSSDSEIDIHIDGDETPILESTESRAGDIVGCDETGNNTQLINIEPILESKSSDYEPFSISNLSEHEENNKGEEVDLIIISGNDDMSIDNNTPYNIFRCETKPDLSQAIEIINQVQMDSSEKEDLEEAKEFPLNFSYENLPSYDFDFEEEKLSSLRENMQLIEDERFNENYLEMLADFAQMQLKEEEEESSPDQYDFKREHEIILPNLEENENLVCSNLNIEDVHTFEDYLLSVSAPEMSVSPTILGSNRKTKTHQVIDPCRISIESLSMMLQSEDKNYDLNFEEVSDALISSMSGSPVHSSENNFIDLDDAKTVSDLGNIKNASFKETDNLSIFDDVNYGPSSLFSSSSGSSGSSGSDSSELEDTNFKHNENPTLRNIYWQKQNLNQKHKQKHAPKITKSYLRDDHIDKSVSFNLLSSSSNHASNVKTVPTAKSLLMHSTIFVMMPTVSIILIFIFKKFLFKSCFKL